MRTTPSLAALVTVFALGASACGGGGSEADAGGSEAALSTLEADIGFDGAIARLDEATLADIDGAAHRAEVGGADPAALEELTTRRVLVAAHGRSTPTGDGAGPLSPGRLHPQTAIYDWDLWKLNGQERLLCRAGRLACVRVLLVALRAREAARVAYVDGGLGGRADAFRHAYWNASMTRAVGRTTAESWANAHENGYPDNRATRRDLLLSDMDFHNNTEGRRVGETYLRSSDGELREAISAALEHGDLVAVRYDLGERDGTLVATSRCSEAVRCGR
jgi:hypothetical protein